MSFSSTEPPPGDSIPTFRVEPDPPLVRASASARVRRPYVPAIGPKLRVLLLVVLAGVALLGANSVYLVSVTILNAVVGSGHETFFYYMMFAAHLALGTLLLLPFAAFAGIHLVTAWRRSNKAAVRYGLALLAASLVIIVTGFILWRNELYEVRDPHTREVAYWLHVLAPLAAVGLYVAHRMAGPRIQWRYVRLWAGAVAVFVVTMSFLHTLDPRQYRVVQPKEGLAYFHPSSARTATGNFIPAETLMMDHYCLECHKDSYDGWFHSAHHFSSFNNKAYLFSVRETRQVALERDGNTKAARFCAGCHDPVPFFSGEFDDPNYDDVNTKSSQAGITCTSCHAITQVHSTRGNADYTIEEPQHYPFAFSDNPFLKWVNHTLVKAKPEMHKRTFLKDIHKDSNFCSTCHKVHLPFALNEYKDFLRGQNHHDSHLLSGVSGHGARSFYYPDKAMGKCADCHMNRVVSNDFGARDYDGDGQREIHNHLFLGANTGLATIRGRKDIARIHENYLKEKKVRIDIFGLRAGGDIEGELLAPLRPNIPTIEPGASYLVEVVVRTLAIGHHFSQGTTDSNEIWVELVARTPDGRVIGHSGGLDDAGRVDPLAHFINVYMLDNQGNRIDRRNAGDIFTPLYNKQIPPGASQVVHFALDVPPDLNQPIELEAKVHYRKFDRTYLDYIFGPGNGPTLPIVEMARDRVVLTVRGGPEAVNEPCPIPEANHWQRWNDYGIGLFLSGNDMGGQKGQLKQAEEAFQQVAALGKVDGYVNLARVYIREGRIPDARAALAAATNHPQKPYPWVITWLNAQINERNGYLDEAIRDYEAVLNTRDESRGFDFSWDYEVNNALATALYNRARQEPLTGGRRLEFLERSIARSRHTLSLDSENVAAHYNLGLAYSEWVRATERESGSALSTTTRPVRGGSNEAIDTQTLEDLIVVVNDDKATLETRGAAARRLSEAIPVWLDGPRPEVGSRMSILLEVQAALEKANALEPLRLETARALASVHKAQHHIYKPDETAEGRAIARARARDKAGDQNAQSIVIHPLHHNWGLPTTAPVSPQPEPPLVGDDE